MESLSVADLMTHDLMTLDQNEKLLVADDVMRLGRIRHILVLDGEGNLAGVVSQRDLFHSGLLRALGYGTHAKQRALDGLRIKDAMHTDVVTTTPDTPLREAARVMAEKKIGCLPVLAGDQLVGLVTEGDFVLYAAGLKTIEKRT